MKRLLLTTLLLLSISFYCSLKAQDGGIPVPSQWEYQPTMVETYLYNTDKFNLEMQSDADSVPESMTEFDYSEDLIIATTSTWKDADWRSAFKTEFYLKTEFMVDSLLMSMYDTIAMAWDPSMKMKYDYDGDMQTMTSIYMTDSLTGEWELLSQTEIEYNESGYKTSEITSAYSPDSNKVVVTSKTDYYVNGEGRVDSTKSYFNVPVLGWSLNSQTNYYYNANGTMDYQENLSSNFLTQTLSPSSKTEYSYDMEGNQDVQMHYDWDIVNMEYMLSSKDSTVFNDNNNPLVMIDMQKPLLENTLYVNQKTYFKYDTPSSVFEPMQESFVSVYPNPATDFISVQTKRPEDFTVRLFNLSGKLVYENSATEKTTQVPVHHLTEGSYLLRVSYGNSAHSQIVIVR